MQAISSSGDHSLLNINVNIAAIISPRDEEIRKIAVEKWKNKKE